MRTVTAVAIIVVIIMIVIILFIMLETKVISTTTTTTTTTTTSTSTNTSTSTPPQYDTVTIINPSSYIVQLIYYGEQGYSTAVLNPNQSVTLTILNNTTVKVEVLVDVPTRAGILPIYCTCYSFAVTGSGTITLDAAQLDACNFNCLSSYSL